VWLSLAIVGLWSQAFKQYKWANWVHAIAMSAVIVVTLISGAIAIFTLEEVKVSGFHKKLGGFLLAAVIIQGVSGAITWKLQISSRIRPDIVSYSNTIHHLLGYILLILFAIELIQISAKKQNKIFFATIIVDVLGILGYLLFRLLRPKMEKHNGI